MDGWVQSSTVMDDPETWTWSLCTSSAGRMDYVAWIRLRVMMDWMAWMGRLVSLTKASLLQWMILDVGAKARAAASLQSWMKMFTTVATKDSNDATIMIPTDSMWSTGWFLE
ncbi:predicted protein [Lichtheimia corymbifera JMRC:FSU:9682]|uniref:Uncharacterized protein n=1 Tax=Lichtheimia corymbifera JMRC:FSU:9682 TaxID=1263082 RepID=A0A068RX68_9FUNG|nr:predicted protein [Lichtheimia corymbifera JMRC:FSU:9682]